MPSVCPDTLALNLALMARQARSQAPTWDGAGISVPVMSPGGGSFARALPGRGLYLFDDLKNLGIRRPVPGVFEYSKVQHLRDWFAAGLDKQLLERRDRWHRWMCDPERGAIATYDGIINARGAGKAFDRTAMKTSITTVANAWSSLFRAGGTPGAGAFTAIPGGAAHSNATPGAWSYGLANPTAPDKQYLLTFGFTSAQQINILVLVDSLVGAGGISASVTSSTTVTTTALTRYTNGEGVLPIAVVTTALGTGTGTSSINSYTDQDNNAAQAGQAFSSAASLIVERVLPTSGTFNGSLFVPLAAADYGVRSVENYQFSAAHSAGVIALDLVYQILWMPGVVANAFVESNLTIQPDAIVEIAQTSGNVLGCLVGYVLTNTTTSGILAAFFRTCQG